MKYFLILCWSLGSTMLITAQIPEAYTAEMKRMVGTWTADNASYKSETETDDAYCLEWRWGAGKQSVLGILYGIKSGVKSHDYWQFFQFWDPATKKMRVIQVSAFSPFLGEGYLELLPEMSSRLLQTFTRPDGQSYEEGHRTIVTEGHDLSTSYTVEGDKWTERRTYKWVKQPDTP